MTDRPDGSRTAQALGFAGLVPFLVLGALVVFKLESPAALPVAPLPGVLTYAATILSFLGALHWGMAIGRPGAAGNTRLYVASVIPSLIAWVALALPPAGGAALLATGFAGWNLWERGACWSDYPAWFQRLRTLLTAIVTATMAAIVVSLS